MTQKKPNILLIALDTVRADHLPMWGYEKDTTPFLKKFIKSAVTYKRAVSTSPWTLPSHVSLFSGLHPSQHGVMTSNHRAGKELPLIADVLRKNGYQTAGFTNNPWASSLYSLDRGFDYFVDIFRETRKPEENFFEKYLRRTKRLLCVQDGGAGLTNNYIKKWLSTKKNNDEPFFIFVNYMDAHSPYLPKRDFPENFSPGSILEVFKSSKLIRNMGKICLGSINTSQENFQSCINLYDDAIKYLDKKIGLLINFLQNNFLLDNTMVIVTSDHGENFGEHKSQHNGPLLFHYFSLYDTLLHVPLIIKYPHEENAGSEVDSFVQLTEVPFIIADTAGIDFSTYSNKTLQREQEIISEYVTDPLHLGEISKNAPDSSEDYKLDLRSIRKGSYKLIISDKNEPLLYDIHTDPKETNNIANKHPELVDDLKAKLENWYEMRSDKYSVDQADISRDNVVKQRLMQLGYL